MCVAGKHKNSSLLLRIDDFHLRLRRGLDLHQGQGPGVRCMQHISYVPGRGEVTFGLIQVFGELIDLSLSFPNLTLCVPQIAPQQDAEHGQQQHYSHRRKGEPARPHPSDHVRLLRTRLHARLCGNRLEQPLPYPVGRFGPYSRQGQQRRIGAQRFQFTAALAAGAQVRLKLCPLLLAIERTQGVERQRFRELWMPVHANAFLKASNPVRMRVLMVPSGSPVLPAISVCVMPSKNAISSVLRCSWGSCARTPRTLSTASFCAASSSRSIPVEIGSSSMSSSAGRRRRWSMARLRAITASQGASRPRFRSKAWGLRQSCRKISCTTSSAAVALASTRRATPYTTPE